MTNHESQAETAAFFSKKRLILWSVILILLLWHIGRIQEIRDAGKIPLYDFAEYWAACRAFLAGLNPYSPSTLLTIQRELGWTDPKPIMMWNPPWILPLLIPFSFNSFWLARGLWFLLNVILALIAADWFWRLYGGPPSRRWISWLATILFIPVGTSLFLGQISPLVLAGLCGFLWALRKKRPLLAGAFTILISIKPHLLYLFWLFMLFWILRERMWKVLWGALLSLTLLSLIVILINPLPFTNYFTSINSDTGPQIWQTPTWGVALLMLLPKAGRWLRFVPSAAGIVVALWLWRSWGRRLDWKSHLPTIILLSITSTSFTWMFDWVVLLPVVILLLCWFCEQPAGRWWLLAALAIMQPLLVFSPAVSRTNFYTIWLPPTLWLLYTAGSLSRRSFGEPLPDPH